MQLECVKSEWQETSHLGSYFDPYCELEKAGVELKVEGGKLYWRWTDEVVIRWRCRKVVMQWGRHRTEVALAYLESCDSLHVAIRRGALFMFSHHLDTDHPVPPWFRRSIDFPASSYRDAEHQFNVRIGDLKALGYEVVSDETVVR